jgi:hypothetical protein
VKQIIAVAVCAGLCFSAFGQNVGPAPAGEPREVARRVITENEHPCPKVKRAFCDQWGAISAIRSNGEDYRVMSVRGKPIAMRCSVVRQLGINGC